MGEGQGDFSSVNRQTSIQGECDKTGTKTQFSCPYEKQQNGFCERNIGIWKLCKSTMNEHAGMTNAVSLWAFVARQAAIVLNMFHENKQMVVI